MEKLKPFIDFMKKHGFWVLSGLVLCIAAAGYYLARSSLTAQISTRKSAVDSAYTQVSSVRSLLPTHPNKHSHEKMDGMVAQVTEDVNKAWQAQYARQEVLFQWPIQAVPPESREQTLAKLNRLRPIELSVPFPVDQKTIILTDQERKVYRDYIAGVFPQLASIIGCQWKAELKAGGGGGGGGGMAGPYGGGGMGGGSPYGGGGGGGSPYGGGGMNLGGGGNDGGGGSGMPQGSMPGMMPTRPRSTGELVYWSQESQQELMGNVISWFNPNIAPETIQICYTQEDLWVLQGLLEIIQETNRGARENFQAPIKEIDFIRFGKAAMGQAGSLNGGGSSGGSPYGGGNMGNPLAAMGSGGSPYGGGKGKSGTAAAIPDPADNRYVDQNFKPVPGAKLRTAMKSKAPGDALFAVAKRIPVRMRFSQMDQRKLNHFLAVCGSMRMVLEVRQVRINTESASTGGAAAGGGGGAGKMAEMGMVGVSADGGGPQIKKNGANSGFDVPVEVYGTVYLYNPVNIDMLGIKDVQAGTKLNTSVESIVGGDNAAPAAPNTKAEPANPAPANNSPAPAAANVGSVENPAPDASPTASDPPGQPGDQDDR